MRHSNKNHFHLQYFFLDDKNAFQILDTQKMKISKIEYQNDLTFVFISMYRRINV